MCQVNTDPMRSRKGYLQVVGKNIYKNFFSIAGIIFVLYFSVL